MFGKASSKRREIQLSVLIVESSMLRLGYLWRISRFFGTLICIIQDYSSSLSNHVWAQTLALALALGWQEKIFCAFDLPDTEV